MSCADEVSWQLGLDVPKASPTGQGVDGDSQLRAQLVLAEPTTGGFSVAWASHNLAAGFQELAH